MLLEKYINEGICGIANNAICYFLEFLKEKNDFFSFDGEKWNEIRKIMELLTKTTFKIPLKYILRGHKICIFNLV